MTGRAVVLRGDAAHLPLPGESVDLIVTSPPYWSLRDYRDGGESLKGQIGSEETWHEYLANLLACTQEWARVLKPSGSMFVVLGDKYGDRGHGPHRGTGTGRGPQSTSLKQTRGPLEKSLLGLPWRYAFGCMDDLGLILRAENIWHKNGLPESVYDRTRRQHEQVFHLVKSQRYFAAVDEIRQPHRMKPQRRPGGHKQRQKLGVLPAQTYSTSQRDEMGVDGHPLGALPGSVWDIPTVPLLIPERLEHARCCDGRKRPGCEDGLRHHAAFPPALARKIILGWSPSGICTACSEGRRPVAAAYSLDMTRPQARRASRLAEQAGLTEAHFAALLSVGVSDTGRGAATQSGTGKNSPEVYALAADARAVLGGYAREYLLRRPTRFDYACACTPFVPRDKPAVVLTDEDTGEPFTAEPARVAKAYDFRNWTAPPTRPAVVVDPCGGTGTTALVASVLGRDGFSFDRSADYCRIGQWRTADPGERARALGVPKPPPVPDGQASLFDLEAS